MTADSGPVAPQPFHFVTACAKVDLRRQPCVSGWRSDKHKGRILLNSLSSAKEKCRRVKNLFFETDKIFVHLVRLETLEINVSGN